MAFKVLSLCWLSLVSSVHAILAKPDCSSPPLASNDVCNTALTPSQRAAALTAALTVEEKVGNLVNNASGIPSLGVPEYEWWSEALHGLGFSEGVDFGQNFSVGLNPLNESFSSATSFANPILLAAAFDDAMIKDIADVISTEARAFSNYERAGLDFWTPNINGYKDPRWGRGMETPGEDPLRIKNYVKAFVEGMEGPPGVLPKKTITTCKHFAGYDLEDSDGVTRHDFNAVISTQELVEYYMPPFQQCFRDSRAGSAMCSYNAVNGVPACADEYLLDTILRDHWNWTDEGQPIFTDCGVLQDTYEQHNYTDTAAEAAAVLFAGGSDNICSASSTDILDAYQQSLLSEADIDRSFNRLTEALVRLGYYDPADSNPYGNLSWSDVNTPAAEELARRSAAESMVLLKNDGTLPMDFSSNSSVAIIGPWANVTWELLGTYFGISPFYHSPLFAAEQLGVSVHYAAGASASANASTTESLEAAAAADVVVYFGGINLAVESETLDRTTITWPAVQLAEIAQLCALGKPCIVVQYGDQLDDTALLQNGNVSALLWGGYPGQDGGPAAFDVLTGDISPAGRLPVTQYPADYVDQVLMTDMSLYSSNSSPGRTYMYYDEAVLPFGFGLHYTTFNASFEALSAAQSSGNCSLSFNTTELVSACEATYLDLCPFGNVTVKVTNTGATTSDYVALVFLAGSHGPEPRPMKRLSSYSRARGVTPRQAVCETLGLTLGNLARVNTAGDTVLYPGEYELLLDVPSQASMKFQLVGEEVVLDSWPQPPS
ncbi:glycoside hydrolase superfamily [Pestalotiopsis sp. NC0098]|nr:glycoside hydrolase superfamily [Pestalotiopsis sp. NC0098]